MGECKVLCKNIPSLTVASLDAFSTLFLFETVMPITATLPLELDSAFKDFPFLVMFNFMALSSLILAAFSFCESLIHCPRAGLGWVKAIFVGPDPGHGSAWPQARRVRPGPGQGRPWPFDSKLIFFFKCSNFNIFVDFYVLLNSSVNSYLFMMKWTIVFALNVEFELSCICFFWKQLLAVNKLQITILLYSFLF